MRTIQYLLVTIVCAAGAALLAHVVADRISASFEHMATVIENPREAVR
jgi:hypothetical protein